MIKDTDYAYAVARIRANERYLLSDSDMENLISCSSLHACFDYLSSKGWMEDKGSFGSIAQVCRAQNDRLWTLLSESVPDINALKVLTVLNDFFNIKAAVKAMLSSASEEDLFVYPTSLCIDDMKKAILSHEFSLMDEPFGKTAEQAYLAACTTGSGRSADVIIDRATMVHLRKLSDESKSPLVKEIGNFICASADIKIAVRCCRTGKDQSLAEAAIAPCDGLDSNLLVKLCCESEEKLFDYLYSTDYETGARLIRESTTAFEKWSDNSVIEIAKKAKYMFFGFEPICAFYYAKQAEIKCVRIILCGKESGVPVDTVRERVRALYV